MEHKAFEFFWENFENELLPLLKSALSNNSNLQLEKFIEMNLDSIYDPYEGNSLNSEWKEYLETGTIQELGDFALTKYYSVSDDFGISEEWLPIQSKISEQELNSLLGTAFAGFDPGCYGSYFQTPSQIRKSMEILSNSKLSILADYAKVISKFHKGLYVTF